MVAPQTENRMRKMNILRECFNNILDLMLYKDIQRDRVNMARFKELQRKVNEIHYTANFGNEGNTKFTNNSENGQAKDIIPEDDDKGDELHEK